MYNAVDEFACNCLSIFEVFFWQKLLELCANEREMLKKKMKTTAKIARKKINKNGFDDGRQV